MLQEVEWGTVVPVVPPDLPDPRGRKTYAFSPLDAFIEDRPALDRGAIDTDRADNTLVYIFDAVAVEDSHVFRYGDPPHTYSVKAIDGIVQDEESGTRYFSVVTVIR